MCQLFLADFFTVLTISLNGATRLFHFLLGHQLSSQLIHHNFSLNSRLTTLR
jgi:hypothetical protein